MAVGVTATIGPVADVEYHVALAYYPEGADVSRWSTTGTVWDDAAVTWEGPAPRVDISCDVISLRLAMGRDLPLERFRPGAATVVVDDPDGIYSPWRDALPESDYATIRPGIDLVVWVDDGGTIWPRFAGIVDAIEDTYDTDGAHRVTFTAFDYLSLLAAFDGVEQPAAGAGELPGARLSRIADNAEYDGVRTFDAGSLTLQATTLAKNALDEMGMTVDTETGALFASRAGALVFRDRTGLVSDPHYTDVQAIFGDEDPEICYTEIRLATDSDKLKNVVTVANAGGSAVTLTDLDSVSLYKPRTYRRLDLIHEDGAESTIIAQRHLDFFAYAANRVERVSVDVVTLDPVARATVLALDVLYRIEVRRRAVGSPIVAELQIQAIEETVTGSAWTLSYTTFSAGAIFTVGRWDRDLWDSGLWGY